MKLKLPNWGSLCKPNLLLNSDFRNGIVNQKGKTEYNNTSYSSMMTIDGWFTDYGKVNVYASSVYFNNTGNTEYGFKQPVKFSEGTYTFYLDCAISGSARLLIRNTDNEIVINETLPNTCKKSFTFTDSIKFISIIASAGSAVSFNFMKIEKEEHYTGMPAWDEAFELRKCQYRFQTGTVKGTEYTSANQQFIRTINIPTMAKKPSVSYEVNDTYGIDTQSVSAFDKETLIYEFTKNANNGGLRYGMSWEADAYDHD